MSKSRATHWALTTCNMLCATWYQGTAQLLSLTEFKSHLFQLILLAETKNRSRRGGNCSTWRKALTTSFRKCHILKPENSSPNRDSNPQARKAEVLTITTCIIPCAALTRLPFIFSPLRGGDCSTCRDQVTESYPSHWQTRSALFIPRKQS